MIKSVSGKSRVNFQVNMVKQCIRGPTCSGLFTPPSAFVSSCTSWNHALSEQEEQKGPLGRVNPVPACWWRLLPVYMSCCTTIILILQLKKLGPEKLNTSFTHSMNKYWPVKRLYHFEEVMTKLSLKILNEDLA